MLKRRRNARCTAVGDSVLMNSRTEKKSCAAQQPFCSQLTLLHGCALGERSSGGTWNMQHFPFQKILCCIVAILLSTDVAAQPCAMRGLQWWYLKDQDLFQVLCRLFTYHVHFRKYRRTKLSPSFRIRLYYILCISWIIKCLIIIDARCKLEDTSNKCALLILNVQRYLEMRQDAEIFYYFQLLCVLVQSQGAVHLDMPGNFAFPHLIEYKLQFLDRMYFPTSQTHYSSFPKLLKLSSYFTQRAVEM